MVNLVFFSNAVVKWQHDVALSSENCQLVNMNLREKVFLILKRPVEQKSQVQAFHVYHDSFLLVNASTLISAELKPPIFNETTLSGRFSWVIIKNIDG